MFRVDLRAAQEGPVATAGRLAADDPALADTQLTLVAPVVVSGRLNESGPGQFFWRAKLTTTVATTCRRCLTPVEVPVTAEVNLLFTEDPDADDPATVIIEPNMARLDLRPAIREELILAAPEFALCREDCRGLCPRCGADLNAGPCTCRPEPDPRWAALEALKRNDDETR
jgi:uncharacterized protein